jgi:hypothetical protein
MSEADIEVLVQDIVLALEKIEDEHQFSGTPKHLVERAVRDEVKRWLKGHGHGTDGNDA